MNRDLVSPRLIGVLIVAVLGVTIAAAIGAPAVQATNDDTVAQATTDDMPFAQQGAADCSRCHDGTKGSGLNPAMCGECHTETYEAWQDSGHAEALSEGSAKTKIRFQEECARCHVESSIKSREDIDFQTHAIEVGKVDEPVTCEVCHAPPEDGWFDHFAKGGDLLAPNGTGPHGGEDAQVRAPQEVCTACHSNNVVLQLANESTISPHSATLVGTVDGDSSGDSQPHTTTTTTATQTTDTAVPGFGIGVALVALLGAALLVSRRR